MNPKLRIAVFDDEDVICETMKATLETFPYVEVSGIAQNGSDALRLLRETKPDLVFLDVDMGDTNGMELAAHICRTYPDTDLVFLTGHTDYALEGYNYEPLDYLIKPVNLLRLERVLLREKDRREKKTVRDEVPVRIGLPIDGGMELIQVNQVIYIEKYGRKVYLVDQNGGRFQTYYSLQKLEGIFSAYGFFRCHQSFLVNLDMIRGIALDDGKNSYNISLQGTSQLIPLSRGKYSEIRQCLAERGIQML